MSQIERNNNGNDGNDSSAFRVYMYDVFTTKFSVLLFFQHAIQCARIHIDQGLFSVRALVFDLAQLTSQKRFDGGYEIIEPSTTFLGTSYGQIVVAVFT